LRVDRIGMRMLGKQHLDVAEYLYLKMALAGTVNREARFVMVDEVQDYTESQLMVLARYFSNAHFLLLGDENQAIREGTASFARIRDVFETSKGSVSECRLLTSYRSSPEITNLFKSLMPASEGMEVQSVQESGIEPVIRSCSTVEEHRSCVLDAIAAARDDGGLSAVIAANKHAAEIVMDMLGDDAPPLVDGSDSLPESGVFVTYLKLAKGLEFDSVIIPDASASVYPDNEVSRHRLYTAVSRATKRVTILCQGTLTPLLSIDR
ncbi:MAG: ATP-binding domain-containing protein, partial [Eggerthellaceae bacterium]|nr:ATP-binding domain-containing protein [Eggerthellaceae bacterium]